jgi:hypothetical protein
MTPRERVYETHLRPSAISALWTRQVTGIAEMSSVSLIQFKNDTLVMRMRVEELRPSLIRWCVLEGPPEWVDTDLIRAQAQRRRNCRPIQTQRLEGAG